MTNKKNSGQVVLMVLLTMIVVLTIAMGIFANSLTDTAVTISQQKSERAFSLAEAGIENLLAGNEGTSLSGDGFTVSAESATETYLQVKVNNNAGATVFLREITAMDTPINGLVSVDINWGKSEDTVCGNWAGLIITKWKKVAGVISTQDYAYNRYGCSNLSGFTGSQQGDSGYYSKINIAINKDEDLFLRIRPILNSTDVYALGANLPTQQTNITSAAKADDSLETRKITVSKANPSLPEIFDYTLFSGASISQ